MQVCAVILAGGLGSRMGGTDKGLQQLLGRPLVAHVIERLRAQRVLPIEGVLINANRNLETYRRFGLPVCTDLQKDFAGPLAGFESALDFCVRNKPQCSHVLFVPCDSPLIPLDLLARLAASIEAARADIAVVRSPDVEEQLEPRSISDRHKVMRIQPVFSLMHVRVLSSLRVYLLSGERKIAIWMRQQALVEVPFDLPHDDPMSFFNTNTQAQLAELQHHAKSR